MITYSRSAFGLNLLFRVHGSPLYRSVIPALLSVIISIIFRLYFFDDNELKSELEHPYVIGMIISGITFLIVFRASQGYNRYWDATSKVYGMHSKWMDAAIHTSVYHLQSKHHDAIKPPSFFDYQYLNAEFLTRDRERLRERRDGSVSSVNMDPERMATRSINRVTAEKVRHDQRSSSLLTSRGKDPIVAVSNSKRDSSKKRERLKKMRNESDNFRIEKAEDSPAINTSRSKNSNRENSDKTMEGALKRRLSRANKDDPAFLVGPPRLDGSWGGIFPDKKTTYYIETAEEPDKNGYASFAGGHTPSLFLQELAHLTSLLSAVALSTLRNDVDEAQSPLDIYEIGSPWPEVDANKVKSLYDDKKSKYWDAWLIFVGVGRTPEQRTMYNSRRPISVLGGISDNEIKFLQMARGKYAKTQLCFSWLSEFVTREHLAGSMGTVGPPIISRTIQFLGDGMFHYNQARKIMFVPFPFPHAQLSAAFVLVMIPLIPLLMDQYIENLGLGLLMTFLAQMVLSGINEVATELENPFRNVPNELPVVYWQAEFNEALITMFSGFHPDFFWDDGLHVNTSSSPSTSFVGSNSSNRRDSFDSNDSLIESTAEKNEGNFEEENGRDDSVKDVVERQGIILEKLLREQMRLNDRLLQLQSGTENDKKED